MPVVKADLFEPRDVNAARLARALSHPARVAILRELARRNACVCGEIVDIMPLAQATVSQHLRELLEAGLIKGTVDGPRVCYCLDPAGIQKLERTLQTLVGQLRSAADASSC